jgi:hypothetical protein
MASKISYEYQKEAIYTFDLEDYHLAFRYFDDLAKEKDRQTTSFDYYLGIISSVKGREYKETEKWVNEVLLNI